MPKLCHTVLTRSLILTLLLAGSFEGSRSPARTVHLEFSSLQAFPGDIVRIDLSPSSQTKSIDLSFLSQKVLVHRKPGGDQWQALLGIDLETKPGRYQIKGSAVLEDGEVVSVESSFQVLPKKFPVQRIQVQEKYVTLDPEDAKRAEEESERLEGLWKTSTEEKLWRGQFMTPVESTLTSGFGRRRIVNNQPRSPHSGVDLKASTGTSIRAANDGRIVLAEELFFSGNTVVIDHGLGLYTYYAHCSKILVKLDEQVRKGEVIAEVGATGRVTGPHLHWACRLKEARVNPLGLTKELIID
jgi:murein DD-endopeptidase MepM/ murein hydrolase activator NlpD